MSSGGGHLGAIGSGGAFEGFDEADFDAYLQKKWRSNAYTLERRRAKDRLLALTRAVASELEEELANLELGASEEAPSVANRRAVRGQWAYFTRAAPLRASLKSLLGRTDLASGASLFDISVQHQHINLRLGLDADGFRVGVEVAPKATVDRSNAQAKLAHGWARDQLHGLCRGLPGASRIGFAPDLKDALTVSAEDVAALAARFQPTDPEFVVEAPIARDDDVLRERAFVGTAAAYVAHFLPIYRFFAWDRDNDHTQVRDRVEKQKKAKKEAEASALQPGTRVVILSGLFSGRAGYLQDVDNKGRAKVMVGPVSVTIDLKDLKA